MTNLEILTTELANSQYAELVEAQNYPAIANLLNNRPLISNPEPQSQTPKRFQIEEFMPVFKPQEIISLLSLPNLYERFEAAVNANDRTKMQSIFMAIVSLLSEETITAFISALAQTEPDPSYQDQILGQSRAEILGVYPVKDTDVQAVLNAIIE